MKKKVLYIIIGGIVLSYLLYFFIDSFILLHKISVRENTNCTFCNQIGLKDVVKCEAVVLDKKIIGYGFTSKKGYLSVIQYIGNLNNGQTLQSLKLLLNKDMIVKDNGWLTSDMTHSASSFDVNLFSLYPACNIKTVPCNAISQLCYQLDGQLLNEDQVGSQCIRYEYYLKYIAFAYNQNNKLDLLFMFPQKTKLFIELHAVSDSLFMIVSKES